MPKPVIVTKKANRSPAVGAFQFIIILSFYGSVIQEIMKVKLLIIAIRGAAKDKPGSIKN
jgi:hypothetical protein